MQKRRLLFLIASFYTGAPLLFYGLRYKIVAPLYLFANDAFYYLDIARNSVGMRGFSFDGTFQTNGFHPLWEYFLIALGRTGIANLSKLTSPVQATFYADVLTLALGAGLFCVVSARYFRRPLLALLTVTPGMFWLLTAAFSPAVFCTWSYANGMESALALMLFSAALLAVRMGGISATRTAFVSFLLGLMVLARLDDIFIAAALLAWIFPRIGSSSRVKQLAALSPAVVMITAYVFYNRITVGTFLPISGAMKSGFALPLNLKSTLREFLPIITGDKPTALLARSPAYDGFAEISGRILQMVLPALICVAELLWARKRKSANPLTLMHALALGVILKATYNLVFVQAWDQGSWYYTVSIAIANLILVRWIDRLLALLFPRAFTRSTTYRLLAVHLLLVLLAFNVFISVRNFTGPSEIVYLFSNPAPLQQRLAALGADRILEYDDGFTSYVARMPSSSVTGLALDRQAASAAKQGHFLDLEYKRGFRFLVARGAYHLIVDDAIRAASHGFPAPIGAIHNSEFRLYRLLPLVGDGSNDDVCYYKIIPVTP